MARNLHYIVLETFDDVLYVGTSMKNIFLDSNIVLSINPVPNTLASMFLLLSDEKVMGQSGWAIKTRNSFSSKNWYLHQLVISGFFFALLPLKEYKNFEAYLSSLEKTTPTLFPQRFLNTINNYYGKHSMLNSDEIEKVLFSIENFQDFLNKQIPKDRVNQKMEETVYQYLKKPVEMKKIIINYLSWFWEKHFKAEWEHTSKELQKETETLSLFNIKGMSRLEIIEFVTGRYLNTAPLDDPKNTNKLIYLVPNIYIGPYLLRVNIMESNYIFFGFHNIAKINKGQRENILYRMLAFTDDNHLHILQLLKAKGEMNLAQISKFLNLPLEDCLRCVSQLNATGYIQGMVSNGKTCYRLNKNGIRENIKITSDFLLKDKP